MNQTSDGERPAQVDVARYFEALESTEKEFGLVDDGHPFIAYSQMHLSWALQDAGRYEEAVDYAKRAYDNFNVNHLGIDSEFAEAKLAEESARRQLDRSGAYEYVQTGIRVEPQTQRERSLLAIRSIESLCSALGKYADSLDVYHAARLQSAIDILGATSRDPAGVNPVIAEQAISQAVTTLADAGETIPGWLALVGRLGAVDDSDDGAQIAAVFNGAIGSIPARDRAVIHHASEERNEVDRHVDATEGKLRTELVRAAREGTIEGVKDFQKTLLGKIFPAGLAALIAGTIGYWSRISELAESILAFLASIFGQT